MSQNLKTFVTTIRVDIRDIAKIAMFMAEKDFQLEAKSRSSLAAAAVRMISSQLEEYTVNGTQDAINILVRLGYGQSLERGRRDFVPLLKQLSKESISMDVANESVLTESQDSDNISVCAKARKMKQDATKPSAVDLEAAKSIIAPEEEVEEVEEAEDESEAESEQLKTRTAADEQKDIKQIKKGLGTIPEEVISDE